MVVPLPAEVYDRAGDVHRPLFSHATAYAVTKGGGGLKVLWKRVIVITSLEKTETSGDLEKEIEKGMKARARALKD